MANIRHSLFSIAIAALGLLAVPHSAQAASFAPLADLTGDGMFNDADYKIFANGSDKTFTSKYVFESRAGNNNSEAGIWEAGAFESTYKADGTYDNTIIAGSQRGRTWTKNALVDFSLQYTGSQLIYKLGAQEIKIDVDFTKGAITDLMIRTAAGLRTNTSKPTDKAQNTTSSLVSLSNLSFGGATTASLQSSFDRSSVTPQVNRDVDYLRVTGLNNQAFTLTGQMAMDWTDAMPTNSNLAMQIKVGSTPRTVPEPGAIGALLLVGGAVLRLGKRKQVC